MLKIFTGGVGGAGVDVNGPSWSKWWTWWCLWSLWALPALNATLYNWTIVISVCKPSATGPVIDGPPEKEIPFGRTTKLTN